MFKVKILGAGSIGNHLANASRHLGWVVHLYDKDEEALKRTRESIYPSRYGYFDEDIKLFAGTKSREVYDIIMVGTPPNSHIELAMEALLEKPKAILIEKPLTNLNNKNFEQFIKKINFTDTKIFIGYDHVVGDASNYLTKQLKSLNLEDLEFLDVEIKEHWQGIFNAHPWIKGPEDTYLGYYEQGGGACLEHSHGLNMWQHIALSVGAGKIKKVSAYMSFNKLNGLNYDKFCSVNIETENGLCGRLIQDVLTFPPSKKAILQSKRGSYEWHCNFNKDGDRIVIKENGKTVDKMFKKNRPDDFINELKHISYVIHNSKDQSPISINNGIETMKVIEAIFESDQKKKFVEVKY